jgi:uncharacterized membrane protein HdeD (DUF308 family)
VLSYSRDLRRYKAKGWGWALAAGILLPMLAAFILIKPVIAIVAVIYMTAFLFVCTGIFMYTKKLHIFVADKFKPVFQ